VHLGELIHVDATDKAVPGCFQGDDWNLNHFKTGHQVIKKFEGQGVMDIFRIAKDNNVKVQAGLLFKLLKATVNFIQVVSFGGRPGFGVDNFNNLGVSLTDLVNLSLSFRIIRIDADKNKIIAVINGVDRIEEHPFDDACFLPGRKHQSDRLFVNRQELVEGQRFDQLFLKNLTVELTKPVIKIDKKIIKAADGKGNYQDDEDIAEKYPAIIEKRQEKSIFWVSHLKLCFPFPFQEEILRQSGVNYNVK